MKKRWIVSAAMSFFLVGIGITIGGAIAYGGKNNLPDGFTVAGLRLEGLPAEEALEQVRNRVAEWEAVSVSVVGKDGGAVSAPKMTFKQLGMNVDVSEGIAAIERFRDIGWLERAQLRMRNAAGGDYAMNVTWDEARFETVARTTWRPLVSGQPANASRAINDKDEVVYTPETLGRAIDVTGMFDQVRQYEPITLAVDAAAEPLPLQLPTIETAPEITVDKLKEEGIERKIAEFTTSFTTSGAGRSHNVTAAAKALNDTLLMPDEVFDYDKIVKLAEEQYGWKEAPVILKGKLTPGIGGGICQVSSTLYNAALLAGLDIVERRNHSLAVHYLPAGLDATYAEGYINFKFRNSTGKQLLIRTVVQDKKLTIKLFGTLPSNVEYRTERKQLKVNPPKTVYVANDELKPGKQDTVQKGEPGFVVETYLVKRVDGAVVERRKLSRDTYRATDALIAVNPQDTRLLPADDGIPSPLPGKNEGPIEPV
ncbi:VanW family protein [Cohnella panacarvi]|uniref:VanW family protein n=1 Tax=Cohnella panacarvi TaxID=400776 RepID=UPI00047A8105|nr:VanW family protein [Cohnella panacarvi]